VLDNFRKIIREHRLKVTGAIVAVVGTAYSFFTKYEIVLRERHPPAPTVVINETRTPRSPKIEVPEVVPEPQHRTARVAFPTDMAKPSSWAYYIRDPILAAIRSSTFDLIVTDIGGKNTFSRVQIEQMKADGKKILAYASLGEAEKYRPYWHWKNSQPVFLGKESDLWKGVYQVTDLLNKEWVAIVKKQLISYMDAGFDGIVISGLEGKHVAEFLEEVKDFISARNAKFRIFVQDYLEPDALPYIDGVVKQNLMSYYGVKKLSNETVERNLTKLRAIKEAGKIVLVMSYAKGAEWKEVKRVSDKEGFVAYNGPIKLDVLRFDQG